MFGPPASAVGAGALALVVSVVLLWLGYLIADLFVRDRDLDTPSVLGLSFLGTSAFALVLMVTHMATRGWFFSWRWSVPLVVVGTAAVLTARKARGPRRPAGGRAVWIALALVAAAWLVWCTPAFRMLPLTATPDTQLHNGWINQLMNGYTTPGAVITGDVPNYYPWMFHALGVIAARLMPGSNAYLSLHVLQFVIVGGQVLALFALGRHVWRRSLAGFGAALFGAASGGIGLLLGRGAGVVTDARANEGAEAVRFAGDLLFTRSYNVAFHSLAPPFPRDMAFALVCTFVFCLVLAVTRPSVWARVATGISLGLVGLTGGESFFVSMLTAIAAMFLFSSLGHTRGAAAVLIPAFALWALWIVPIAINYVRLGGFVDITHVTTIDLPAYAVVGAWGVGAAAAAAGFFYVVRSRTAGENVVLVYLGAAAMMLAASAVIPELLGDAFDTLGRRHRYWPLLHLGLAVIGGRGLVALASVGRVAGRAAIALVAVVAVASPVAASVLLPDEIGRYVILEEALRRERKNVLRAVDRRGPASCVVAAPQEIAREVFSYTGYPLVLWTGNWFGENRARIRWTDIYGHITPQDQRVADNRILVNGWGSVEDWDELAAKYGVDIVVAPAHRAGAAPFAQKEQSMASVGATRYTIVRNGDCAA